MRNNRDNTPSHIQPKTVNQDRLLRAITRSQLTIAIGPAGVGKTWCAVNAAVNLLLSGQARQLVFTRTNAPTGRSLGFFPGTVTEKLEPWLAPMIGVARSRLGATNYDSKVHSGSIVYVPLETIRGTSFEDSVVLVDEAQNLDYEEVKAVTTRIGEGSRMVLMGDPMQRDIRDSGLSEFEGLVHHYGLETEIPIIKFTVDDIVRSDLVATLVRTFMLHEGASHGT